MFNWLILFANLVLHPRYLSRNFSVKYRLSKSSGGPRASGHRASNGVDLIAPKHNRSAQFCIIDDNECNASPVEHHTSIRMSTHQVCLIIFKKFNRFWRLVSIELMKGFHDGFLSNTTPRYFVSCEIRKRMLLMRICRFEAILCREKITAVDFYSYKVNPTSLNSLVIIGLCYRNLQHMFRCTTSLLQSNVFSWNITIQLIWKYIS